VSVITYLESRAAAAVLSATEESSITKSISTLQTRLNSHFGSGLSEHFRFCSSVRGTILPRAMDASSDIDYLLVFSDSGYKPQTYLDRLKRFAQTYYASSDIKQDSPSLVLELNHIKFDLVPALAEYGGQYRIPSSATAWQYTNPTDFNATLNAKNAAELYKIKPMIRLAKYWNAHNGSVFDAFELEKYAVAQSYWGVINLRDYLFTLFDTLGLPYGSPQWRQDRLDRAKKIIESVRKFERDEMPYSAENEVKKLIPEV